MPGTYPTPVSSSPTAFTLLAGSSNQVITVGASMLPIAGYRFWLNARHRPVPVLPSLHCKLASDDCQRKRDACYALMNPHRQHGWLCPLSAITGGGRLALMPILALPPSRIKSNQSAHKSGTLS
jgi:hypothetical protein